MVTTTIEQPVDNKNHVENRRLVDRPDTAKAGFFSKLAGSGLGRWTERYAEYQLETWYRNGGRL